MPLVPYLVLLLLSCGIRLVTESTDASAAAPIDRAATWALGHDIRLAWPVRSGLGLALGLLVGVVATRVLSRWSHARAMRELNAELARGLWSQKPWVLTLTAMLGGAAEEVFFRGVLHPWLGVWLSALAFGAVHIRFHRRLWLWPLLSVAFGLVASLTYGVTGTLLAPIAMHVLVNLEAQRRLGRQAQRQKRVLGGLLRS